MNNFLLKTPQSNHYLSRFHWVVTNYTMVTTSQKVINRPPIICVYVYNLVYVLTITFSIHFMLMLNCDGEYLHYNNLFISEARFVVLTIYCFSTYGI